MISDIKLIMTLLVRDEEDIIRENIDFHLSQGVDFFIVTDNLSVDSTPEILKEYESKGLLHYIHEPSDNYNQHEWVTRMARLAKTKFEADWVINNDADEFWWPKGDMTLKEFFKSIPSEFNQVEITRFNFVPVNRLDQFYKDMIYREKKSFNFLGKPLPKKVAHRANSKIVIHQGNHKVTGLKNPTKLQGGIDILHFPIRTHRQFENKIRKGGAAYENNISLNKNIGDVWRKLYKIYETDNSLKRFYLEKCFDSERIKNGIRKGKIIKDTRLKNYFHKLYEVDSKFA